MIIPKTKERAIVQIALPIPNRSISTPTRIVQMGPEIDPMVKYMLN